ncbi:MAG: hypothetical protein HY540_08230 [Deltaproteobacteria bacterium]|nr:hypothetical protein [Deltaproteobacteria bacterium]
MNAPILNPVIPAVFNGIMPQVISGPLGVTQAFVRPFEQDALSATFFVPHADSSLRPYRLLGMHVTDRTLRETVFGRDPVLSTIGLKPRQLQKQGPHILTTRVDLAFEMAESLVFSGHASLNPETPENLMDGFSIFSGENAERMHDGQLAPLPVFGLRYDPIMDAYMFWHQTAFEDENMPSWMKGIWDGVVNQADSKRIYADVAASWSEIIPV